jgi:2-polyprenyl-3-methyl-5-hydroxy-6-metoxy-1,4-benzoquinol methylase
MKILIANTIVKWFKQLGFAGRLRFWCLYLAYRITGWHIRHQEWDFVLDYLPSLGKWQKVRLLDVGCSRSLFCHEVVARGYSLDGIDLENPYFEYPGTFQKLDIRETADTMMSHVYDFVTCISVLEHVEGDNGQRDALKNMINALKVGGRLLLTIPTNEFAQGHPWHGFNREEILSLLPYTARMNEYTERMGQLCLSIERVS